MTVAAYAGPNDSELQPDQDVAWAFLDWWFRGCTAGRVEIGWMDPSGRGLIHFERFPLDEMVELSKAACTASAVPGQSVYVRASTVCTPDGAAYTTDSEFVQAPGIWGDMDTPEHLERAKSVDTLIRPNASVITGNYPHKRFQTFFRTDHPISSADTVRSLNRRLLALYGGDPAVVNPTRLMRLPGTIAWPWKPGRVVEMTGFVRPTDGRPESYPLTLLTTQLPQISAEREPSRSEATGDRATLNTAGELIRRIQADDRWHDNMIRLVAHWIGRGWSDSEIRAASEAFTLSGYSSQQTRAEVDKAIKGGRDKWAKPNVEPIVEGVADPAGNFSSQVYDPWDALVAPEFPIEALPDVLRRFVETRARVIGCDIAAIAWSCISAASAGMDGQARLHMKRLDNWTVPPAIWVALVGNSSTKKTAAINTAWSPLERMQATALREWAKDKALWDALPKKDREATPEPPQPIRLISHGATIESLQGILSRQDRGIGVLVDELAGLIEGMDKYSGGKSSGDRAFYLQAYNGGGYVIDRIGRGTSSATNLLATICGGIQPDKLAQFKDLSDDGLWQRFVPVIVKPSEIGTDEAPGAESAAYAEFLTTLALQSGGAITRFSEAAFGVREQVEQETFHLERSAPLGRHFAAFCGKVPGLFGRLSLVLSQMEGMPGLVSVGVARAARMLCKSAVTHAGRVALSAGGDADAETVQSIAGFILTKKKDRVLASELARDVWACRKQSVAAIQRFVSPLVAGGWLNPEKEHGGNTVWFVNPAVHTGFAHRANEERARRSFVRNVIQAREEGE